MTAHPSGSAKWIFMEPLGASSGGTVFTVTVSPSR